MRVRLLAILAIAGNTFREAVRNKVLASLAFFALVLFGTSVVFGQMSLHHEVRVTIDFGLYLSTIFGVVITIYSMVTLLHAELTRRTIYTLLSKPIARWEFFLGKFLGVAFLAAVLVAIMGALTALLVTQQGGELSQSLVIAFGTVYLQLVIVAAITATISTFSSPLLSGMFAATVFVCGNLVSQISAVKELLRGSASFLYPIIDITVLILPSFEALNLTAPVARGDLVPLSIYAQSIGYAVTYSIAVLLIGVAVFSRKDFQ